MGRFISRDPLRFEGGDINLYRFVGNNPINNSDAFGLKTDGGTEYLNLGGYAGFGGQFTVTQKEENIPCPECTNGKKSKRSHSSNKQIKVKGQYGIGIGGTVKILGFGADLSFKGPQAKIIIPFTIKEKCDGSTSGGGCTEVGLDIGAAYGLGKAFVGSTGGISNFAKLKVCTEGNSGTGEVKSNFQFCFDSTPFVGANVGPIFGLNSHNLLSGVGCKNLGTVKLN